MFLNYILYRFCPRSVECVSEFINLGCSMINFLRESHPAIYAMVILYVFTIQLWRFEVVLILFQKQNSAGKVMVIGLYCSKWCTFWVTIIILNTTLFDQSFASNEQNVFLNVWIACNIHPYPTRLPTASNQQPGKWARASFASERRAGERPFAHAWQPNLASGTEGLSNKTP